MNPRVIHPIAGLAALIWTVAAEAGPINAFTPGDLVISTVSSAAKTLDSASPITLIQLALGSGGTTAAVAGTLTLPQAPSGANQAISGEYGSASEGILQRSADGHFLTMMGYGVNADTFNAAPVATYGNKALGQTTSLTGASVTTVPRVVALIGADASVDTSTALTGVFNLNNPRSAATVDGSSFYVAGQASSKTDPTQGVFYATRGSSTATAIDTSTDARVVSIFDNGKGKQLFVSRDFNPPGGGSQNFTNVSSLTGPGVTLPTASAGLVTTHLTPPASPPSVTGGNNGSIDLTAALANGVNNARIGSFVYLSPEQYCFAAPNILYVADSGQPKNGNANKAALGEGGLQKWVNSQPDGSGTWSLQYDLVNGLGLVNNANANSNTPAAPGVTGLFGLTGQVVGDSVELFATSYGLNEESQSYLYEITDLLGASTVAQVASETFTELYTDSSGQMEIRGVAFAPTVPEPASLALVGTALAGMVLTRRRRPAAR